MLPVENANVGWRRFAAGAAVFGAQAPNILLKILADGRLAPSARAEIMDLIEQVHDQCDPAAAGFVVKNYEHVGDSLITFGSGRSRAELVIALNGETWIGVSGSTGRMADPEEFRTLAASMDRRRAAMGLTGAERSHSAELSGPMSW